MGNLAAEYGSSTTTPWATCYVSIGHLGSTRMLTDAQGNVIERHEYMPFGDELFSGTGGRTTAGHYLTNPIGEAMHTLFTGKYRDTDLAGSAMQGLDYFGARYFSAAQGRFTSPDEFPGGIVDPFSGQQVGQPGPLPYADITDPQTLNKYAYVRNSPLRYVDPNAHCIWDLCIGEGAAVYTVGAAAIGTAAYLASPQGQKSVRATVEGLGLLINKAVDAISSLLPGNSAQPQEAMGAPPSTDSAPSSVSGPIEFTKGTKDNVDARAGGKCEYCGVAVVPGEKSQKGVRPPANERQTDHYDPRSKGASDTEGNAANSCRGCSRETSNTSPKGTKWELPRMKPKTPEEQQ